METSAPILSKETSLLEYFYQSEARQGTALFLRQPFGDTYYDLSWYEAGQQARQIAAYLQSLNLPPQSPIGLVSKNCAEWIITDIAIMISGHVSVPFYPTLTAVQLNQVLTHSGCKALFVGKLDGWEAMKPGVPAGLLKISFPTYNPDEKHVQWDDILRDFHPVEENPIPNLDDLFSIIYTSGTTGNPKGVMISHRSTASATYEARKELLLEETETRFFSYLPLCHIAERNIVEATCLITGGTIYFAESLDTFAKNLAEARPTHFLAVPRIWTKFQLGILAKMPQKRLDLLLKIPLIKNLIKSSIRKKLGLNDAKLILTGAAPMPPSLIRWFGRLGIIIQEAYGMTENLGAVSMMPKKQIKEGTVGKPYPGMEVKIDPETGEILTKSASNMVGYYREPGLTAQTLNNGWLHTGDVGELDEDSFLKITGRIKEIYKTSKGEYIVPSVIEGGFSENTIIEQICIAGQNLPQPIALIVLSEQGRKAQPHVVSQSLHSTLSIINPTLQNYEKIRKIVIVKEDWSVENNMLTPTLKIKRTIVETNYAPKLELWYNEKETILWE